MKALIQRVSFAKVLVEDKVCGEIGKGVVMLCGFCKGDSEKDVDFILKKVLNLKIFEDEKGRMGKSLKEISGELLIVSQFTLCATTKKGNKPSFDNALAYEDAKRLYDYLIFCASQEVPTKSGIFGAFMNVYLTNYGPVTFLIESKR